MANRRCFQALARYLDSRRTLAPISHTVDPPSTQFTGQILTSKLSHRIFCNVVGLNPRATPFTRHFCSKHTGGEDDDNDDDGDESGEEEETESDSEGVALSAEEKEKEAAEIGYKVVGQLQESDQVSKPYEPVFAVVQIGSHQFKVSNGDAIFTERLKFCDINDKLILNKVLMLGSKTQTIIGRPILPDSAVHAVVEEHALDAKVIVFKKKRRKNYRRTKGHRQELTKLRITDIEGIRKPEATTILKTEKKDKSKKTPVKT